MLPTTSTHCSTCQKIIRLEEMEEHLKAHLAPTSRTPFTREQHNPSKLKIPSLDMSTDNSCSDLLSIHPDTLPAPIYERRTLQSYTNQAPLPTPIPNQRLNVDKHNPTKPLQTFSPHDTQMEELDQVAILKSIPLNSKQQSFEKNKYKPYEKGFTGKAFVNQEAQSDKGGSQETHSTRDQVYSLVSKTLQNTNKQQPKEMADVRLGLNTHRKGGKEEKQITDFNEHSQSEVLHVEPSQPQPSRRHIGNCVCEMCGGFYCSNCKSTVPPALRGLQGQDTRATNTTFRRVKQVQCGQCQP